MLAACSLDHKPLLIEIAEEELGFSQNKHGSKFEARWVKEEESEQIITNAWHADDYSATPM